MHNLTNYDQQMVSGGVSWIGVLSGAAIVGGTILAVALAPEVCAVAAVAAVGTELCGAGIMDISAGS